MKSKERIKEVKRVLSVMDKFFAKHNIVFSATFDAAKLKPKTVAVNQGAL